MGSNSKRIGAAMRAQAAKEIQFITLQIDRNLRRRPSAGGTPVDTGHARANWVPSIGNPFMGEVAGLSNVEHDAGVVAVLGYRLGDGPAYVTNNAPYVQMLNDGWSKQQPAGFVERAIDEALAAARDRFGNIDVTAGTRGSLGAEIAGNVADAYNPLGDDA